MKDKRLNLIDNGLNEVFMFLNQLREKSDKDRDAYNILFNYQIEIAKARAELKNIDKRFQEYDELISKLRFECDKLRSGKHAEDLNEGKTYENVTSRFEEMITAFQADFSLATLHDDLDYADFRDLIRKNNPKLMKDIDLLGELEFKIRHKKIIILEDITEDTQ